MKMKKSFISKIIIGTVTSSLAIAAPITSVALKTVSVNSVTYANEIVTNTQNSTTTSYIKIKSMDDANLTADQKDSIRRLFKNAPSQITSNESIYDPNGSGDLAELAPASIFHLLEFDETKVYGLSNDTVNNQNAPRVTNLSDIRSGTTFKWSTTGSSTGGWVGEPNSPDPNLSPESPIPYLINTNGQTDAEKIVSQQDLDAAGILFLRVDMKDKVTNQPITEFLTISGFNSILSRKFLSSNIDLPGSEYKKSVTEIKNSDLISYPQFVGNRPSQVTLTSRTNNPKEGSLNYSLLFNFEIPKNITIDPDNKNKLDVLNRYTDASKTLSNTSYHQEFVLKGFIKSPNISNNDIIIILASIIAGGVVICLLVYLGSLITRKIRFMKKM